MSSSLFRKEVIEHRKDRLYGEVILLQPLSITLLVSTVVFVCLLIVAILGWGTYARKETVSGYLLPDKGIVKTYATQPGTIAKVHVTEGDEVTEGQPLITILSERMLQGGKDIDTLVLQEIDAAQEHLHDQIKGEKNLLVSEISRLQTKLSGLQKELNQVEQSLKAQQDRLHILEARVASVKKLLNKKHISEQDYQKIYDEFLAQKQHYQELLRVKANLQNTLAQTESELEQLPIHTQTRINSIENSISENKQRLTEVKGRRTLEIRSPVAGTVTALQVREGQWQATNTPLLAILPKDAKMQVELFVPSRAIGFITPNQTVRIRYDAFPYQRFGMYEGVVSVISKHILLPNELPVPLDLKEPVYRLTVELTDQYVKAYGKTFPLQAGMSLEADIILEKQRLFEWIFDPIISLKGRF